MKSKLTTMKEEQPSLEAAQTAVGGYVEVVPVGDGQLLVNEDGRRLNLAENPSASQIAGQPIVGDALLLKGKARWD